MRLLEEDFGNGNLFLFLEDFGNINPFLEDFGNRNLFPEEDFGNGKPFPFFHLKLLVHHGGGVLVNK